MLPEIVITKIEENQPCMENMCVQSGAIRFLSSTSASVESDFTIKYFLPLFLFICEHDTGERGRRENILLILSYG